jgi:hypothetical protein
MLSPNGITVMVAANAEEGTNAVAAMTAALLSFIEIAQKENVAPVGLQTNNITSRGRFKI